MTASTESMTASHAATTDWFGHPRGLTILFLTEMWEKFSYFGMRTLLVYYMTKSLLMSQSHASWIYGLYTAFAYFTPIIGGVIADRYLGRRRAVIIGGSIMALGHFMMTFESLFYPALATIAIGNGLFLPSLPSQVQALYRRDDPRIGSAYNVYYVGINLGAVLAAFVCGALGELYGWHWGFGAAGIGMCLGLVVYVFGGRYLPAEVAAAAPREDDSRADHSWRTRVMLLLGVVAIVVVFRGAYEQIGNTVALWADSGVDRRIGANRMIPATWFQALNPLLVFTLTPLLLAYWKRHADQQFAPLRRMAFGAFVVAGAYVLLALAAGQEQSHWLWLAAFLFLYTLGELFILPTGLGLFGRLAPRNLAATSIALWFSASFAGNLFAGALGTLWSRFDRTTFFLIIAVVAALAAMALLLIDRPSRRLLRDGGEGS